MAAAATSDAGTARSTPVRTLLSDPASFAEHDAVQMQQRSVTAIKFSLKRFGNLFLQGLRSFTAAFDEEEESEQDEDDRSDGSSADEDVSHDFYNMSGACVPVSDHEKLKRNNDRAYDAIPAGDPSRMRPSAPKPSRSHPTAHHGKRLRRTRARSDNSSTDTDDDETDAPNKAHSPTPAFPSSRNAHVISGSTPCLFVGGNAGASSSATITAAPVHFAHQDDHSSSSGNSSTHDDVGPSVSSAAALLSSDPSVAVVVPNSSMDIGMSTAADGGLDVACGSVGSNAASHARSTAAHVDIGGSLGSDDADSSSQRGAMLGVVYSLMQQAADAPLAVQLGVSAAFATATESVRQPAPSVVAPVRRSLRPVAGPPRRFDPAADLPATLPAPRPPTRGATTAPRSAASRRRRQPQHVPPDPATGWHQLEVSHGEDDSAEEGQRLRGLLHGPATVRRRRARVLRQARGGTVSDGSGDEDPAGNLAQFMAAVASAQQPTAHDNTGFGLNQRIDAGDLDRFNAQVSADCELWNCVVCARGLSSRTGFDRKPERRVLDLSSEIHQRLLMPIAAGGEQQLQYPATDARRYMLDPELAARPGPLLVCSKCRTTLKRGAVPQFCYATCQLTMTPPELQGLTKIERALICRRLVVTHAYALSSTTGPSGAQLAVKGWVITMPVNNAATVARSLPRAPGDVFVSIETRRVTHHLPPTGGGAAVPDDATVGTTHGNDGAAATAGTSPQQQHDESESHTASGTASPPPGNVRSQPQQQRRDGGGGGGGGGTARPDVPRDTEDVRVLPFTQLDSARAVKVRVALDYLRENNPHYRDVGRDAVNLRQIEVQEEGVARDTAASDAIPVPLPEDVQHVFLQSEVMRDGEDNAHRAHDDEQLYPIAVDSQGATWRVELPDERGTSSFVNTGASPVTPAASTTPSSSSSSSSSTASRQTAPSMTSTPMSVSLTTATTGTPPTSSASFASDASAPSPLASAAAAHAPTTHITLSDVAVHAARYVDLRESAPWSEMFPHLFAHGCGGPPVRAPSRQRAAPAASAAARASVLPANDDGDGDVVSRDTTDHAPGAPVGARVEGLVNDDDSDDAADAAGGGGDDDGNDDDGDDDDDDDDDHDDDAGAAPPRAQHRRRARTATGGGGANGVGDTAAGRRAAVVDGMSEEERADVARYVNYLLYHHSGQFARDQTFLFWAQSMLKAKRIIGVTALAASRAASRGVDSMGLADFAQGGPGRAPANRPTGSEDAEQRNVTGTGFVHSGGGGGVHGGGGGGVGGGGGGGGGGGVGGVGGVGSNVTGSANRANVPRTRTGAAPFSFHDQAVAPVTVAEVLHGTHRISTTCCVHSPPLCVARCWRCKRRALI